MDLTENLNLEENVIFSPPIDLLLQIFVDTLFKRALLLLKTDLKARLQSLL